MIRNILRRDTGSPTRNALNAMFLPEDQDAFARSMGYADAEQMIHYEDQQRQAEVERADCNEPDDVPPMTDREVDDLADRESSTAIVDGTVQYLAPPPSEILVLMRQDSREVYDPDVVAFYPELFGADDMAGVF